ncbi:MAG: porin family protein [Bacteriovoracaceae bacterium]|nr:porin family protein [Bacteriovoracaceae bacterium]
MKKQLSTVMIALMLMSPAAVLAQDLLDDVESTLAGDHLEMDDLDISGQLTPAQRLEQTRKKMEERNRQMVDKKIENIRIKQEVALTKKLQSAFDQNMDNIDSVSKKEAAVVEAPPVAAQPVIAPQPTIIERVIEVQPVKVEEEKLTRITPFLGLSNFKGSAIDFESKANLGVNVDYVFMPQLTLGVGVGYTTMEITDTANSYADYTNLGNQYGSIFPNGRQMSFDRLSLEANSRYFLTMDSKLKPYVGAGLGYNRTTIKYEGTGNGYSYNGVSYGSEGVSTNFMTANIRLGAEVDLTSSVALGLDLGYTKALTSGFGTKNEVSNVNEDQRRLEKVSKAIEDADNLTVNAGVVLKF